MPLYFGLNNEYNPLYDKIGKAIKELYPIGIENDTDDYKEYFGSKKIDTILGETFDNYSKVSKPWKEFLKKLKNGRYKKISSAWMPHDVAFSGKVSLERYNDPSLFRSKYLEFSVSRVAPFYTVYGIDETVIRDQEIPEAHGYSSINVITQSPYSEFKDVFNFIEDSIAAHFPGYDFIPIKISLSPVEGLHTRTCYLENSRVHNALFNDKFNMHDVKYFRGESFYGSGPSSLNVSLVPPPGYSDENNEQ